MAHPARHRSWPPDAECYAVRGEAPIDRQADADYEARARATQPQHGCGDRFGPAKAADRLAS
jgi:hypothetical protein